MCAIYLGNNRQRRNIFFCIVFNEIKGAQIVASHPRLGQVKIIMQ